MTDAIRDQNHVTVQLGVSSVDSTTPTPFVVDPATGRLLVDASAGGYTNLTQFVDQTPWRLFYSNTDGDVIELALGANGTFLKSNGAAAAPTFATPAGSGTVTSVAMTVPTGLTITGSPITSSGTLAVAYDTGYQGFLTTDKTKLDFITVTQAVDLDTMESGISTNASSIVSIEEKTDFITVTQAVNLDTMESGISTNASDIVNIETKTDFITVTQAVNLDTMESDIDTNNAKVGVTSQISNVVEDTTPQAGGDFDMNGNDLTDVQRIIIDGTPDADHTATGNTTATFNAGATLTAFEVSYMGAGGKWLKSDASTTATADKLLAINLEAGTDTNPIDVALPGSFVRDDTWAWTVGGAVYLSETAGALTQTAPTTTDSVVRVVGYALTADVIWFSPETGVVHI